ncbi:MAG: L-lactate dehydrogenase [Epsilonproteobacteria bacterium]|nr:L-lactate dehydrogenase [Campylobacterota bacterium]
MDETVRGCKVFQSGCKVAIVGAGFVGSTAAYALMIGGTVSEIVLIDVEKQKAQGHALDLQHCMQFTKSVSICAGSSYELIKDASIVIVAAGVAQAPGQSRSALLEQNVSIFKDVIPKIVAHNKDCILLIVTNPLDVLTYVAHKLSGFDACRVFGTGTVLDSARLRYSLGEHFNVSPKDVIAYVLGEHGDSEFVWESAANIAGIGLHQFEGYQPALMKKIYDHTKRAAYEVIEAKGATYYAIALVIAKIVRALLLDQLRVFTVSTLINNVYGQSGVCLSVPTIIRAGGVCQQLPLQLSQNEQVLFSKSAQKIREGIEQAMKLL